MNNIPEQAYPSKLSRGIVNNSNKLYDKACKIIPGGVNSPVRSFSNVNSAPIYIKSGKGSRIYDNDSRAYTDYCGSWGPLILGHAHPKVVEAVVQTAKNGLSFGACHEKEIEFAEIITDLIPSIDMVRVVNSGTEAVMTALRLARAATGKNYILKFNGCYHGHSDCLLIEAGSGLLDNSIASSAGIPDSIISKTISVPYNNFDAVKKVFECYDIAAVIIEPIACNMGLILPENDFLKQIAAICKKKHSLLVFDEVITGFRFHAGDYASLSNIQPDISVFGKIIGGGMPIGAIGGRKEIMENLAPLGPVYQAGTLSGNPVALAAGIATLKELKKTNPYPEIHKKSDYLATLIKNNISENNLPCQFSCYKGIFTLFFTENNCIKNLETVKKCNLELFAKYHNYMLKNNIYISPSQFEVNFISAAHSISEIKALGDSIVNFLSLHQSL
jgi:glutamate-1-semialdehyde 2,1-aminomutase